MHGLCRKAQVEQSIKENNGGRQMGSYFASPSSHRKAGRLILVLCSGERECQISSWLTAQARTGVLGMKENIRKGHSQTSQGDYDRWEDEGHVNQSTNHSARL
jgi:hypothetical protein